MTDAPRRRRLDPLGVFVGFVALAIVALVGVVVSGKGASTAPEAAATTPPPESDVIREDVVALPPAQILETLERKPATTAKGKLLKSELKKKAERDVAKLKLKLKETKTVASAGGAVEVLLSGDDGLRRSLRSKLKGMRFDVDGSRGFQLSLRADTGSSGGAVFAKCSAAVSELPARKLVASLSARADAAGDDDNELKEAAMEACAASLAEDVSKWIRAHRR